MPRNLAEHRAFLLTFEEELRKAGAPVHEATEFQDSEDFGTVGKYLSRNGFYLFWASDEGGVNLTVATYPGDTFFPGADEEEHIRNGVIDRMSIGWSANNPDGLVIGLPENAANFPSFKDFLWLASERNEVGPSNGEMIQRFWMAFASSK